MAYKRNKALTLYRLPKQLRSHKHGQQDINVLKVRLTQFQKWQQHSVGTENTLCHTTYSPASTVSQQAITSNRSKRQRAPSSRMPGNL